MGGGFRGHGLRPRNPLDAATIAKDIGGAASKMLDELVGGLGELANNDKLARRNV